MLKIKIQKLKNEKNLVFKFIIIIFIFFLSLNTHSFEYLDYEKKINTNYALRNVIEKLSRGNLEKNLREFVTNGRPSRAVGSLGHKKIQIYLNNKLKAYNSMKTSTYNDEFEESFNGKLYKGVNFQWEKKGLTNPDEIIIITANYDTLLKDQKTGKLSFEGEMPGADNNATGVAIMLSIIEILDKLNLPKTVQLIFLDMGEFDSQGTKKFISSKKFISEKTSKKIVGAISLSMLGHDSRSGDNQKKFNNMNLYAGPDVVFANSLIKSGKENYNTVTFSLSEGLETSKLPIDSKLFRDSGLPAVTFSQNREGDLNPRYMTSNDFVETLNMNTYVNVFRYVTSAILAWNYDVVK